MAKAANAHALSSHDGGQALEKFIHTVDPARDGRHPESVNGQDAKKAQGRELIDPVEAFATPVVMLDTPSTAAFTSEASIAAYSGQDLSIAVQADVQHTAAHTWATVSGRTTSLYTHAGGVKAFATNGPLSLRAHTDELSLLADREVTVVSVDDEIRIQASTKIEIVAGQSSIVLDGGNITFTCPGTFAVKGSAHAFLGAGSAAAELLSLPQGLADERPHFLELNYHDEWLQPMAAAPYHVVFEDGTVRKGTLDANGHARLEGVPNKPARVYYGEDPRAPQARVELPANAFKGGSATNEEAIANIERYLAECDEFWAEQASAEQREVRAQLNAEPNEPDGENLWHYLDEARQRAMTQQLRGGKQ